jgi:GNAT superfamily N-acetyltransferase
MTNLAQTISLEIYGTEALLRSLAVDPGFRSTGLGSALVEHAEAHAGNT